MEVRRFARLSPVMALLALASACGFSGIGAGPAEDVSPTEPAKSADPSKPAPPPSGPGPGPSADAGADGDASAPVACVENALAFDGVDDVASVPDDAKLDLGGDFTVEAWIKPSAKVTTGAEMHLVSHHDWPASQGWVLLLDQGRVEIHVYGDESFASKGYAAGNTPTTPYVVAGKWAHVAGTLRGSTLRVYYDGVLRDTQEISLLFARSNYVGRLTFGRASYTQTYRYEGELDDVRISSNARYTGATAPKPVAPFSTDASTIALWHFDETSGPTLVDAQAKHNGSFAADTTAPSRVPATCISGR
ncbi:MAG: LamG domain-containing protein [Deltaproteobacteria bacterium]|nr:LamG domain-containing protein [Deltaproteobacteria bacterium]